MLSLIHLISIKFALIFYNESLTFDFDYKLIGVMTCQFTAIEGPLIRNGDEGRRGGEGGGREKRTEGEGRRDRKGRGGALHAKRTGIEGRSSSAPSRLMTHQARSRLIKVEDLIK